VIARVAAARAALIVDGALGGPDRPRGLEAVAW
jgi:hypothetical protein